MFDNVLFKSGRDFIPDKKNDFIAEIPSGLTSRQGLFDAMKHGLKLPDYFGYNWDALDECLRDLSWITERRIIIVHHDIPNLTEAELGVYTDILAASSKYLSDSNRHELIVIRA